VVVVIRPVRADEHAAAGDVTVRAFMTITPDLGSYAAELRDIDQRLADGGAVLVADVDGAIAGSVTYVPGPGPLAVWHDAEAGGIRMLAVAPEFQRRGIGEALVQACLDLARADARPRVQLHTTDLMPAAQRLYERMGFHRAPEQDLEAGHGHRLHGYAIDLEPPDLVA
jgi:ribosomal protein S18 acetylase RimI-like enzyme